MIKQEKVFLGKIPTIELVLLVAVFGLFYLPWLFENFQRIRVHDTLDSEVVFNYIVGQYYLNTELSVQLALNGSIPSWAFARLMQPLSLLYAFLDAWVAYALTDVIVRIVAFIGLYLLACQLKLSTLTATLLGLCFSTSISFTHFIFTVAGIPFLIWCFLIITDISVRKFIILCLFIFLIGLHISFVLSGLFFIILAPIIFLYGLKVKVTSKNFLAYVILVCAVLLGNANLFYAQFFSDIIWHRAEWSVSRDPDYQLLNDISLLIKSFFFENPWYHVSYKLDFVIYGALSSFLFLRNVRTAKIGFFIFILLFILLIFLFSQTSLSDPLRNLLPFFRSFQWDRFYFLYSALIFITLTLMFKETGPNKWQMKFLTLIVSFQLVFNLIQTPHLQELVRSLQLVFTKSPSLHELFRFVSGKNSMPTFNGYYKREQYAIIKKYVQHNAVLSVGLDPMIAPMNGISSIDGYYNLYPLTYKQAFRDVIEVSMTAAGLANYYDKWGNRVYAFYQNGNPNLINFCAAYKLGAKFIISGEPIKSVVLRRIDIVELTDSLNLYEIKKEICNG